MHPHDGHANATVATWTDITNLTSGYNLMDVDQVGGNEAYYSKWDVKTGHTSINDFYERMKYITRRGETGTIYGLAGQLFRGITHEVTVANGTGTWGTPEFEQVNWSGGTGQVLAVDNKTGSATTKVWIQLKTGAAPTSAQVMTGQTSSATANTQSTTERTLSFPFCGVSTGSAIIGGYGVGIDAARLEPKEESWPKLKPKEH